MQAKKLCAIFWHPRKAPASECLKVKDGDDGYVPFVVEDFFNNPVVLARVKAGVRQYELASLMHVSLGFIKRLEKKNNVSTVNMGRVNKALKNYSNRWAEVPR